MLRLCTLLIVFVATIYSAQGLFFSKPKSISDTTTSTCKPVDCHGRIKNCQYGFQKKDGCEICKCNDPCNPAGKALLCGTNKRCFVHKEISGSFVGRCQTRKSKQTSLVKRSRDSVCEQTRSTRACMIVTDRYFYDSATNKCEQFTFGGCGGSGNNFESEAECEKRCKL